MYRQNVSFVPNGKFLTSQNQKGRINRKECSAHCGDCVRISKSHEIQVRSGTVRTVIKLVSVA
jgi:hypothetical protein